MDNPPPATAFKILTADQWAQFEADGVFHGSSVDLADGYIHLSAIDQLQGTLDKHFAGQAGLVVAEVDLVALGQAIRWEVSRGAALFPHCYSPLPFSAVLRVERHLSSVNTVALAHVLCHLDRPSRGADRDRPDAGPQPARREQD